MGNEKTKVFVDSNVWFSAFYKKGVASDLISKLLRKKFEIVVSELVLEEVITTLSLVYQFFRECPVTVIKNPQIRQIQRFAGLAQRKDLPILVSVLNYKCNFFVTGNKKDFKISSIKKQHNLLVLSPRGMLDSV